MTRRAILTAAALPALALLAWGAWQTWRAQSGLEKGRAHLQMGMWGNAREQLGRYLWLHPASGDARLLMAESLVKDQSLSSDSGVISALEHLSYVTDESPRGADARLQEGRLRLLILRQPAKAERAFRRAIELHPQGLEARYLLWKSLDISGRSQLAEDEFWQVYELTPETDRAGRLREWYMCQFYPATSIPELERQIGFLGPSEDPSELTEYRRLFLCRKSEPDEPLSHAAVAQWFYLQGDPREAQKALDEARSAPHNDRVEPFFLAVQIAVAIDLGRFAEAEQALARWPLPHVGHDYWKWRGVVLDEVRQDPRAAIEAYDHALEPWPGPADWRTRNRKANCLARLRDAAAASQERDRAVAIERLMEDEVHARIRDALARLRDPVALLQVAEFYQRLGCTKEEQAWRAEAARMGSTTSKVK